MAVDDREKRSNALNAGKPWHRGVHPTGTIDEQERIAIGHGYGGNALSPPGGGLSIPVAMYNYRRLRVA